MPEKKKILFLSPYPIHKAPSQRLKYEQYYPYIEAAGYEITTRSFMDEPLWRIVYQPGKLPLKIFRVLQAYGRRIKDLFLLRHYDIVYVHLWVTPLGFPLFEWATCLLSKKVIYDIDDLIFHNQGNTFQKFAGVLKGRTKALYMMRHADHVITCTPYLDEKVRKYTSHTTDISSTIDTESYLPVNTYTQDHILSIGWSGSHSTVKYLDLLKDIFQELSKTRTFKLIVIGGQRFTCEGINIEHIPWSAAAEISSLQKIDIGVYPLSKEEWVLGKSGLKALQYMALGIPTVATDFGTIHRIIQQGQNGFLADRPEEWIQALTLLLDHADLRKAMGQKARETVLEHYSLHANATKYLEIINRLTASKQL